MYMKRGVGVILLFVLLFVPFASASIFGDFFRGKITGNDVSSGEIVCTETDATNGNGFNVLVAGNVSVNGERVISHKNFPDTDLCSNSDKVEEYYCDSTSVSGFNSMTYSCALNYEAVCIDGACGTKKEGFTCWDGDGGINISYATSTNLDDKFSNRVINYFDFCYGNGVMERYCVGDEIHSKVIDCPSDYSCVAGECVSKQKIQQAYCYDGDFGVKIYQKSVAVNGSESKEDYCLNTKTVREFGCLNGEIVIRDTACPVDYVCSDGACITNKPVVQEVKPFCLEDDFNVDIELKSKINSSVDGVFEDYCLDSEMLLEFSCLINGAVSKQKLNCSVYGKKCFEGACVSEIVEEQTSTLEEEFLEEQNEIVEEETIESVEEIEQENDFQVNSLEIESNFEQAKIVDTATEANLEKDDTSGSFSCEGCLLDGKCYIFGYIKDGKFCSENFGFIEQFNEGSACINNFECKSGFCIDEQCISKSIWNRFFGWFNKFFRK